MQERELTSEDCRPLRGMIEEGSGKDGSHDGTPWFKNEMGARCMGLSRKGLSMLIVVADHGISGTEIPDPRSRRTVPVACLLLRRHGRIPRLHIIFPFFSLFLGVFSGHFFRAPLRSPRSQPPSLPFSHLCLHPSRAPRAPRGERPAQDENCARKRAGEKSGPRRKERTKR